MMHKVRIYLIITDELYFSFGKVDKVVKNQN